MKLPGIAQEIADVIGRERALYLIGQLPRCYVGREGGKSWQVVMYVPKTLRADHPLVRIMGWPDAKALVHAFGGEILKPASCADIYRRFRDSEILALSKLKLATTYIAEVMGVSVRHVQNLLREIPPEGMEQAANDNAASFQPAKIA